MQLAAIDAGTALPVPSISVFNAEEGLRALLRGTIAKRSADRRVAAKAEEKPAPAAARPGKRAPTVAGKRNGPVAAAAPIKPAQAANPPGRAGSKSASQDKKSGRRVIRHNQQASL